MNRKYIMFIWLFLTALLLSTTTYAWFSANKIFELNSFDIQIVSRGGMEISTDGRNWKGVIGIVDLVDANTTYPNNLNQIPNSIKPVSSGGTIENGLLKLYYGKQDMDIDGEYYLSAERSIEKNTYGEDPNAHFLAFDLFLKTSYRRTLGLDSISKVSISQGEGRGIDNAFRIGFLNQGSLPENSNLNQIQNLKNANKAYIWEPNYDTHTAMAVEYARDLYGISTQENNAQRIEYYGVISEINRSMNIKSKEANSIYYPNSFLKVPIDVFTSRNNTTTSRLFAIDGGITKVRIYIWVEGQDVDCENNAATSDVVIDLQLVAEET